jgi:integrase/recombinase XerD
LDLLQFFHFVDVRRTQEHVDFQYVNIEFINSITLGDMYAFLAYCQDNLHSSPGTRTRKIVSIRQFWKYLKPKAHLINNNITEELETPKQPKRIVRCLTLVESVSLLIESSSSSARDNCYHHLSELWFAVIRTRIIKCRQALFKTL